MLDVLPGELGETVVQSLIKEFLIDNSNLALLLLDLLEVGQLIVLLVRLPLSSLRREFHQGILIDALLLEDRDLLFNLVHDLP